MTSGRREEVSGFREAVPVWGTELPENYNQFLGFHAEISLAEETELEIRITARSYYRLYINGEILACGPARTARHFSRIDVHTLRTSGKVHIAVETAAYGKPERYCNDCTLEPGMLAAEVCDSSGKILAATGKTGGETCGDVCGELPDGEKTVGGIRENSAAEFLYTELNYRRSNVETMSHSRGIIEWYELREESFDWMFGGHGEAGEEERGEREAGYVWKRPEELEEEIGLLPRRSPYASLRPIPVKYFTGICDAVQGENPESGFVLSIARMFNEKWYASLPEENQFLEKLRGFQDAPFTGKYELAQGEQKAIRIIPGEHPAAVTFANEKTELGFLDFTVRAEEETILDVINTDHLSIWGELRANSYVTRYHLAPGTYHLTTFEPKLVRYVKMIFTTRGGAEVTYPQLLDDSYPDDYSAYFSCSDGELNQIYEGARRTLRLSTLDIFMDCPQRERGGWLCDSHFAAQAAWQMFGQLGTEKDFIENFMKTSGMWNGFFPEVYPGSKEDESDPGFVNWSYWLMTELCDYYDRSGDWKFVDECRTRVEEFVTGLLSLRGASGLIETERGQFVDWSLANRDFALRPISVPNNCLAVFMLERLSDLYGREDWGAAASEMRGIIEKLDAQAGIFGGGGDGAAYRNGKMERTDCPTEGGQALELWSGFHLEDKVWLKNFIHTMGPCPEYRSNPNIGKANLFIGLMIRFDVLGRLGYVTELVRELKDVYLEELKLGSGTFFENINAFSGCHGFNGMAGALLTNKVLGLGQPMERTKTVCIEPHPGQLRWAEGAAVCGDGMIFLKWSADADEHTLQMSLSLPEGWQAEFSRSFELSGWKIELNGKTV